jgi:hypothetical protein
MYTIVRTEVRELNNPGRELSNPGREYFVSEYPTTLSSTYDCTLNGYLLIARYSFL